MRRLLLSILMLLAPGRVTSFARQQESGVPLRIYLCQGDARISGPAMTEAQWQAGRLLSRAGIRIDWRTGEPRQEEKGLYAIVIRFVNEPPSGMHDRVTAEALAMARPFAEGDGSIMVFGDRVVQCMLRNSGSNPATADRIGGKVLGHILAHEIGHLLEREARHSDDGLMKAVWTREDLRLISNRELPFAEEDLVLMKNWTVQQAAR